jgi:CTP-dependent riboflavin kinase
LNNHPGFLWTTTTPRTGADVSLVELITDIPLRETFGLRDGDVVTVDIVQVPPSSRKMKM